MARGALRRALDRDSALLTNPTRADLDASLAALFERAREDANAFAAARLSALETAVRDSLALTAGSSLKSVSLAEAAAQEARSRRFAGWLERGTAYLIGLLLVLVALIVFQESMVLSGLLVLVAVLNGLVAGGGANASKSAAGVDPTYAPPSPAKFAAFVDALDRLIDLAGEPAAPASAGGRSAFDTSKVLRLIQFMLAQSEKNAGPQASLIKEIAQDAAEEAGFEVLWRQPPPAGDAGDGRPLFVASYVDDLREDVVSLPALRRVDEPSEMLQGQVFKRGRQ